MPHVRCYDKERPEEPYDVLDSNFDPRKHVRWDDVKAGTTASAADGSRGDELSVDWAAEGLDISTEVSDALTDAGYTTWPHVVERSGDLTKVRGVGAATRDRLLVAARVVLGVVGPGVPVQWSPGGVDQFLNSKVVTHLDGDDETGHYVFVEGSDTGMPLDEVRVVAG